MALSSIVLITPLELDFTIVNHFKGLSSSTALSDLKGKKRARSASTYPAEKASKRSNTTDPEQAKLKDKFLKSTDWLGAVKHMQYGLLTASPGPNVRARNSSWWKHVAKAWPFPDILSMYISSPIRSLY